jgi:hypothetical protein
MVAVVDAASRRGPSFKGYGQRNGALARQQSSIVGLERGRGFAIAMDPGHRTSTSPVTAASTEPTGFSRSSIGSNCPTSLDESSQGYLTYPYRIPALALCEIDSGVKLEELAIL